MYFGKKFSESVVSDFKDKRYYFYHIAEMNIITIANNLDMSYDFYVKHNMCAPEDKLNALINQNKKLINKVGRSKRQPLIGKFSHVPISNEQ